MHKSVLVVEDDQDIRDSLKTSLSLIGVDTVAASNGKEAWELLEKIEPPCLILLDLMMPVMDGWQFRARQQENAKIAGVPVVVITADGNAAEKSKKMGAAGGGLRKPLDLSMLFSVVKSYYGLA